MENSQKNTQCLQLCAFLNNYKRNSPRALLYYHNTYSQLNVYAFKENKLTKLLVTGMNIDEYTLYFTIQIALQVFLNGGTTGEKSTNNNYSLTYDYKMPSITELAAKIETPMKIERFSHSGCEYETCLFVNGGVGEPSSKSAEIYDVKKETWADLPSTTHDYNMHSVFSMKKKIITLSQINTEIKAEMLNMKTSTWKVLSITGSVGSLEEPGLALCVGINSFIYFGEGNYGLGVLSGENVEFRNSMKMDDKFFMFRQSPPPIQANDDIYCESWYRNIFRFKKDFNNWKNLLDINEA